MDIDELEIGLCWGTLINANLLELVEAAGRHGFPTLAVRPDSVLGELEQGLTEAQLRQRLRDAGVRVRVIDALTGGLPGMEQRATLVIGGRPASRAGEDACFRAAEAALCPMVNVSLYGGQPVPLPVLAEALAGVCRRAATRGLTIVLEFVPDTAIPDIHAARTLVEMCGEANCAILLDPWHLIRSGGTLADVQALPQRMIGALQLDDRTPPAPGTAYVPMSGRDLPGEGQLPLHDIVRAVLAGNPGVTAEIEVFNDELRGMTSDAAAARVARAVALWRGGK